MSRSGQPRFTLGKIKKIKKETRARLFLFVLGAVLLGLSFFLEKRENLSSSPSETIIEEPYTIDQKLLTKPKEKKNPPVRIVIPSLAIDLQVKEARIIKGYWETFSNAAGFGLGSAYPGEVGNQVIFAHTRPGLFLPLKKIKEGDIVYVMTVDKWYKYKVVKIQEVLPRQKEVIGPTVDETLTLFTCSGFVDNKRLIVVAKRSPD